MKTDILLESNRKSFLKSKDGQLSFNILLGADYTFHIWLFFREDNVREEARRGLKPEEDTDAANEGTSNNSVGRYASFQDMIDYIYKNVSRF